MYIKEGDSVFRKRLGGVCVKNVGGVGPLCWMEGIWEGMPRLDFGHLLAADEAILGITCIFQSGEGESLVCPSQRKPFVMQFLDIYDIC